MNHQLSPELIAYWTGIANTFHWKKKWSQLLTGNFNDVNIKWFEGGQLNITSNCLDRHLEKRRNKKALVFEPNNPT